LGLLFGEDARHWAIAWIALRDAARPRPNSPDLLFEEGSGQQRE